MNNGVVSVTLWSATGSNVCEVCVWLAVMMCEQWCGVCHTVVCYRHQCV